MNYGMSYQGSKGTIAEWIIDILPESDVLIDAFGGGGAITHCACLSGKYKTVVYNELEPLVVKGFRMAVNGEFKNENRWISREMFDLYKDTDPYVAICFSYANNLKRYAYNTDIEQAKMLIHQMICSGTQKERRLAWRKLNQCLQDKWSSVENLEMLKRVQNLYNLERMQNLEGLDQGSLIIINKSYDQIDIPEGAIIYCDIPYKNTGGYLSGFNHDAFYEWALNQNNLVFISEYAMPSDFYLIDGLEYQPRFNNGKKKIERLYCNKPFKVQKATQLSLF